MLDKWLHLFNR